MLSSTTALEQLLHIVTARGAISWREWKNACRSLSIRFDLHGLSPAGAAQTLDELGHVEITSLNGSVTIMAAPAVLVRLPKAATAIGVLAGGRSPQSGQKLETAAAKHGARFIRLAHSLDRPETPEVLRVEAEDLSALTAVASTAGIQFGDKPVAWVLAHLCGTVAAYESSLTWRHAPEPAIEGREFNTLTGRFEPIRRGATGFRLIQYFPRVHAPFWEIRNGERAAKTDRNWGIYTCLNRGEREHLIYDQEMDTLAVPLEKPLPRPFGRTLALCRGEAPEIFSGARSVWPATELDCYYLYRSVPCNIADLVLRKLGQNALPLPIPAPSLNYRSS